MNSNKQAELFVLAVTLASLAGVFLCCFSAYRREQRDIKMRRARAKQRREENERLAAVLLQDVLLAEHARSVVAVQQQDITPISVPVTRCDFLHRRRILRPE